MRAIIKTDINLDDLKDHGFCEIKIPRKGKIYKREIKSPVYLVVEARKRELMVVTPNGVAAFTESHKDKYEDILHMIDFVKGEFD